MKIELIKYNDYWCYINIDELNYTQAQFDYVCKHLDFEKLDSFCNIYFNNGVIEEQFYKTYINNNWLYDIYNQSSLGYKYLKINWGKGIFRIRCYYPDKQEFKIIVNKVINIELRS